MGRMKTDKPVLLSPFRKMLNTKRDKIRANRADFRKQMKVASEEAKVLYRRCQSAIRRSRGKQVDDICMEASTYEVARDTVALLSHPKNGYVARTQTEGTPDGSHQYHSVIISLTDES